MKIVKKHQNGLLDKLTFITGIMLPLLTVPQAYTIIVDRQTAGVSLFTWTFYFFASAIFAAFGIIHRERLLMITYIPFAIIEAIIVVGLLLN